MMSLEEDLLDFNEANQLGVFEGYARHICHCCETWNIVSPMIGCRIHLKPKGDLNLALGFGWFEK